MRVKITEQPGPAWTVYRYGGKFTLLASSLRWALALAEPNDQRPKLYLGTPDHERAMINSVRWTPDVGPPNTTRCPRVRLDNDEVAYEVGLREIVVRCEPAKGWFDAAADDFVAAVGWYRHVVQRQAKHVVEKEGRPVAVQRFKSGERKGLIRWPAKMPANERLELMRAVVSNAELVETIGDSHELVQAAALRMCASSRLSTIKTHEAELRRRRERLLALRDLALPLSGYGEPLSSRGTLVALDSDLTYAGRQLGKFDSVNEHGFAPGSIAWLLPAKWDDIQRPRRVRIDAVEVLQDIMALDRDVEHRRLVQIIDARDRERHNPSGEVWAPVDRLRVDRRDPEVEDS